MILIRWSLNDSMKRKDHLDQKLEYFFYLLKVKKCIKYIIRYFFFFFFFLIAFPLMFLLAIDTFFCSNGDILLKTSSNVGLSRRYNLLNSWSLSRSTFPIDEARSWNRLPSLGFRNLCLFSFLRLTTHCNCYMHAIRTAWGNREADRNSSICL